MSYVHDVIVRNLTEYQWYIIRGIDSYYEVIYRFYKR